jgi:hypothetical protein
MSYSFFFNFCAGKKAEKKGRQNEVPWFLEAKRDVLFFFLASVEN